MMTMIMMCLIEVDVHFCVFCFLFSLLPSAHGIMFSGNPWGHPFFLHLRCDPGMTVTASPNDISDMVPQTGELSDLLRLQLKYHDLGELDHFLRIRGYRTWRSILVVEPTERQVLLTSALRYFDSLSPLTTNHKSALNSFLNSGLQAGCYSGSIWGEPAMSNHCSMHSSWAGHGSWPLRFSGSMDEPEKVFCEISLDDTEVKRNLDAALRGAEKIVGA